MFQKDVQFINMYVLSFFIWKKNQDYIIGGVLLQEKTNERKKQKNEDVEVF